MKKELIHPTMLKCALLSNDNNWKKVFENLAYGVCPSGIYMNKNYIHSMIKGKEFSYKLDNRKPVQEIFQEISIVLKYFVSSENNLTTGHGQTNWTQVKKKVIRDTLLERYVLDKSKHYRLSIQFARKLLSFLIVGLMFKTISSKNIEYRNGYIYNIEGFKFENKKIIITKNIYNSKMRDDTTSETFPIHKYLSDSWNLYVQDLKSR